MRATDNEGPPSRHLSLADLDAAALVLVIPAEGEASLWTGEPRRSEDVARALHRVGDEIDPGRSHGAAFAALRALCGEWDGLVKGETHTTRMIREAIGDADA